MSKRCYLLFLTSKRLDRVQGPICPTTGSAHFRLGLYGCNWKTVDCLLSLSETMGTEMMAISRHRLAPCTYFGMGMFHMTSS